MGPDQFSDHTLKIMLNYLLKDSPTRGDGGGIQDPVAHLQKHTFLRVHPENSFGIREIVCKKKDS